MLLPETYEIVNSSLSLHAGFQRGSSASANYLSRFSLRYIKVLCFAIFYIEDFSYSHSCFFGFQLQGPPQMVQAYCGDGF